MLVYQIPLVTMVVVIYIKVAIYIDELHTRLQSPGNSQTIEDTSIKHFRNSVFSEIITELEAVQHQYGINTNLLKEDVELWKTKCNWDEREKFPEKLPQFTTTIKRRQIHFIHAKPSPTTNQRVLPVLILHGCGGTVRKLYDIIPLLTTPQKNKNFVFEVIAPSLPGCGFSQATTKPELGAAQMAVIFKELMKRLGFEKYYVQGGDWGGVIVSMMAVMYSRNVLGLHSSWRFANTPVSHVKEVLGSFYSPLVVEKEHEGELYPLTDHFFDLMLEFDYFRVTLKESPPVGLAAYMLEKFTMWTNPEWKNRMDGRLTEKFTYTQLLDNIMIYWVTDSITTSMRIYAETFNITHRSLGIESMPILAPNACAKFKYEIAYFRDNWLKEKFTWLVQSNECPTGGHFAAFEEPQVLADDIWSAVKKFETFYRLRKNN